MNTTKIFIYKIIMSNIGEFINDIKLLKISDKHFDNNYEKVKIDLEIVDKVANKHSIFNKYSLHRYRSPVITCHIDNSEEDADDTDDTDLTDDDKELNNEIINNIQCDISDNSISVGEFRYFIETTKK